MYYVSVMSNVMILY